MSETPICVGCGCTATVTVEARPHGTQLVSRWLLCWVCYGVAERDLDRVGSREEATG